MRYMLIINKLNKLFFNKNSYVRIICLSLAAVCTMLITGCREDLAIPPAENFVGTFYVRQECGTDSENWLPLEPYVITIEAEGSQLLISNLWGFETTLRADLTPDGFLVAPQPLEGSEEPIFISAFGNVKDGRLTFTSNIRSDRPISGFARNGGRGQVSAPGGSNSLSCTSSGTTTPPVLLSYVGIFNVAENCNNIPYGPYELIITLDNSGLILWNIYDLGIHVRALVTAGGISIPLQVVEDQEGDPVSVRGSGIKSGNSISLNVELNYQGGVVYNCTLAGSSN